MKYQNKFVLSLAIVVIVIVGSFNGILWMKIISIPEPEERWIEKCTPEEAGVDSNKLNQILKWIKAYNFPIDSLTIIKNGKMILDESISIDEKFNQLHSQRDTKHIIASCTKSITSTLIGIAIDKGYIKSVNEKVLAFFPDYLEKMDDIDARKEEMTIDDLLTMRTGLDWWQPGSLSPDYDDPTTSSGEMYSSSDFIEYILNTPMIDNPGVSFSYSGGASHLLSAIIQRTTGLSTLDFAKKFLFSPLKISEVYWPFSPEGVNIGGGGMKLNSRDMAKIGYLYLNNGSWNGEQIVSKEWVKNATTTHHFFPDNLGYGYQWWTVPKARIFSAWGAGCQKIYIIPELEMVVVFTALILTPPDPELGLLYHIFGAIKEQQTFSNYSFSMKYPHGMEPVERNDIMSVSETSGQIDVNSRTYPLYKYTLYWETIETIPSLENVLDAHVTNFMSRNPLITVTMTSIKVTTPKENHSMLYQEFEMIERGSKLYGVAGTWYCEKTSKIFTVFYYDLEKDIVQTFLQFKESSINCH
jgi:CubicO group peptidase (beta-lactamase class C family)